MGYLTLIWAFFVLGIVQISTTDGDTSITGPEVNGEGDLMSVSAAHFMPVAASAPEAHKSGYYFSLSLSSSFPEDLEVSDYCLNLLRIFGERYVTYVNCSVSYARPVKMCEKCYMNYSDLRDIYNNISSESTGPGNESCYDSLVRSDRLMLVYMLDSSLKEIWSVASCSNCLTKNETALSNDTLNFLAVLNISLSCFEKQQQGNYSELCKECKAPYRRLSVLYSEMEKNHTLCIDLEDAMNVTRRLWSKKYGCSFPREETVPVIAVSGFMLFLPVIFYLSSFLHSEQKKRKLIHPKRAKSNHSLMNIQDKFS
ncbi:osteopetrosis-associated transmembrane protein 1 [Sardina pilchardus]|uniref:osteopetrosis-associated transmembrane protein 1 n=1 Tax=Sardina pilchardus TaxID=27697 RepID=UPI002E0E99AB